MNLTDAGSATIDQGTGVGTIRNDEASLPKLSINSFKINEGNAGEGTTTATFTVSLSAASGIATTVNYTTTNGTAMAGSDYISASGTLTFAPGETQKTIPVTVNGDTMFENNEAFTVNLSGEDGAVVTRRVGTATLVNDDAKPTLSIDNVAVTENPSGATATFTVHLSAASGLPTTVRYGTVNGTARAGRDYTRTSGSLGIAAGLTEATITVPILYNPSLVTDASFFVALSGPKQATLGSSSRGTCTIHVPISGATLGALASAQTPISRIGSQQRSQAVDEVIRSIWLTIY